MFCWALLGFACSAKEPTEIVGGVSTQIKVPEYLRQLDSAARADGHAARAAR